METNEFVFKRKRRRLCVHHEDTQTEMLPDIPLDQSTSSDPPDPGPDLIPEVAVLSEPPSSSPTGTPPTSINRSSQPQATGSTPNVLTVESFLRRSVQTFVQTARIVLRPDNFAPPTRSRAYMREGASQRRMIKKPKRAKKPKKPSRIAQTLYRAAVLTDADPLDTLMESSGVSPTRKPLNFVTFNKFSDFVPTMRLSKNVKALDSSDLDPGKVAVLPTQRLGDASNAKEPHLPSSHSRNALVFVPLQEAEAAYSIMFPARNPVLGRQL